MYDSTRKVYQNRSERRDCDCDNCEKCEHEDAIQFDECHESVSNKVSIANQAQSILKAADARMRTQPHTHTHMYLTRVKKGFTLLINARQISLHELPDVVISSREFRARDARTDNA